MISTLTERSTKPRKGSEMSRMPDDFYVGMTLIIDLRPGGKPEVIIAVCVGQNDDVLTLVSVEAGDCYRAFDFVIAEDGEILDSHYSFDSIERLVRRVALTESLIASVGITNPRYRECAVEARALLEHVARTNHGRAEYNPHPDEAIVPHMLVGHCVTAAPFGRTQEFVILEQDEVGYRGVSLSPSEHGRVARLGRSVILSDNGPGRHRLLGLRDALGELPHEVEEAIKFWDEVIDSLSAA